MIFNSRYYFCCNESLPLVFGILIFKIGVAIEQKSRARSYRPLDRDQQRLQRPDATPLGKLIQRWIYCLLFSLTIDTFASNASVRVLRTEKSVKLRN